MIFVGGFLAGVIFATVVICGAMMWEWMRG
jgi:hypothetical protein